MKHILITTIAAVLLVGTVFADPIHDAAVNGDLAGVQAELDKGVDVNVKDDDGWTPLHDAAWGGHKEIAELLIAKGADVNAVDDGWTPLHAVAEEGHKEVAELLIANGADVNAVDDGGYTPLYYAVEDGNKGIVELLLAKDADVTAADEDKYTLADFAIDLRHLEVADLLHKYGGKYGSIETASAGGDVESVRAFLASGIDVNAGKPYLTPLHYAAIGGRKDVVELLIAEGANVNAAIQTMDLSAIGDTSLKYAIVQGNKEIVELLIKNGVDLEMKIQGKVAGGMLFIPPICVAVEYGLKEIIELLINNGADVNAKGNWGGAISLNYAAADGHTEIVELLIAKGANVNAKTDWGRTPLHDAAWGGHKEIVELLIAKGADVNAKSASWGTPLDMAEEVFDWYTVEEKAAKKETAALIRKHGGKTVEELKALMPRLVQHGRFAFSFVTKEGKVYEVQDSFDLLNWEPIRTYTGTGDSVRFDEERYHDPPQIFYRVKMVE